MLIQTYQYPDGRRLEVSLPRLREPVGAGDALKRALSRLGVPACGGCQQRAELLNQRLRFRPWPPRGR